MFSIHLPRLTQPRPFSAAALVLVVFVASGAWLLSSADDAGAHASPGMISDIPSHNGFYRASLTSVRPWTVEVRTASGEPVEGAALALESWMPERDSVSPVRASGATYVGRGRYRIDALHLDRAGWWNVKVQISARGRTDSLAFNLEP